VSHAKAADQRVVIPARKRAQIRRALVKEIRCLQRSHTDFFDHRIHDVDVRQDLATWEWLLHAICGEKLKPYKRGM
jgi:hypothetical protein